MSLSCRCSFDRLSFLGLLALINLSGCALFSDFGGYKYSKEDGGSSHTEAGRSSGQNQDAGDGGSTKPSQTTKDGGVTQSEGGSGGTGGTTGGGGGGGGGGTGGKGGTKDSGPSSNDAGTDSGPVVDPLCVAKKCDANHNPATCAVEGSGSSRKAVCTCMHGYHDVYGDGTLCVDVNECTSGVTCQNDSTCVNEPGTYECQCNPGFVADPTQSGVCIDACVAKLPSCDPNALCMEPQGVAVCRCPSGYVDVNGDGTLCDKDVACMLLHCDPIALCDSSLSVPMCTCPSGFNDVNGNGTSCVDVDECATNNGGCSTNATCRNNQGSFVCQCMQGYTGDGFACADVDECADPMTNDCATGGTGACTNTGGSFTCACNAGYADGNPANPGRMCTDIDECALGTAYDGSQSLKCDANASCNNTAGAFTCACKSGYDDVNHDGTRCTDIDECTTTPGICGAMGACANTPGSYVCGCSPGYKKDAGGSCQDVNECTDGTANCSPNAMCANTAGSFTCTCNGGYDDVSTGSPGTLCVDHNECATNNGGCDSNALCTNTPGSFMCSCKNGFSGNGSTCTDINECTTGMSNCAVGRATCNNTSGSFTCTCNSGYSGDGVTCADIDECVAGTDNCDHSPNACVNTVGGFTCTCPSGYGGTGVGSSGCADTDECAANSDNCDNMPDACVNTPGSFVCSCPGGFMGNGVGTSGCLDINECSTNNGGCAQVCNNTPGSYSCGCNNGYTLAGDNKGCNDINECNTSNGGCAQICTNSPGSYACSCNSGYQLGSDGKSCSDINECNTGNGGCAQICNNSIGSYSCACGGGYNLGSDGKSCNDINECTSFTDNCSPYGICSNTQGSFSCACECGYSGNGVSCAQNSTVIGYGPPASSGTTPWSANYLFGLPVSIPRATQLVRFGLIAGAISGNHGIMALYTDSGGAPKALVASTASTALATGDNALTPTVANVALPAGNYWIMSEFDLATTLTNDNVSQSIDYISHTYNSGLPSTYPSPSTYSGFHYNFYIVVYMAGFPTLLPSTVAWQANYLFGEPVKVAAPSSLSRFGMLVTSASGGGKAQMALYTDNSGAPGNLVAFSDPVSLATGDLAFPVHRGGQCTSLSAGTYWLMAITNSTSWAFGRETGSQGIRYMSLTFGSPLPSTFTSSPPTYTDGNYNFYLYLQ